MIVSKVIGSWPSPVVRALGLLFIADRAWSDSVAGQVQSTVVGGWISMGYPLTFAVINRDESTGRELQQLLQCSGSLPGASG